MIDCLDLPENDVAVGGLAAPVPAWLAAEVDAGACILRLDAACRDEAVAMVDRMGERPAPLTAYAPDQFELPRLRSVMARGKALVARVPGVALFDALPLDALDEEAATAVFWVLGQLLGRPVAQKWDGSLLYHVRDEGQAYGYGVRGSVTNVELPFHVDNAFGRAPPDIVGLLCLQPAARGGLSRFCSVQALHRRMAEAHPRLLERLHRPLLWDRQAEHAAGAPRVARAPMFATVGGVLRARVNVSLVRKGYQVAGTAIDAEAAEALAALESVAADPALWIEQELKRGQVQYLNNRDVVHYRSAFTDGSDPAHRRHLVRTWHRDWGAPDYDG
jgi:alpha-ketoglutarate-dependent taurine dioxygenase